MFDKVFSLLMNIHRISSLGYSSKPKAVSYSSSASCFASIPELFNLVSPEFDLIDWSNDGSFCSANSVLTICSTPKYPMESGRCLSVVFRNSDS